MPVEAATQETKTIDSPESKRVAALVASGWLAALIMLPGGGLLWQWGLVQNVGDWVVGTVLGKLDLSGLIL